jgi:hypothetical protein
MIYSKSKNFGGWDEATLPSMVFIGKAPLLSYQGPDKEFAHGKEDMIYVEKNLGTN